MKTDGTRVNVNVWDGQEETYNIGIFQQRKISQFTQFEKIVGKPLKEKMLFLKLGMYVYKSVEMLERNILNPCHFILY